MYPECILHSDFEHVFCAFASFPTFFKIFLYYFKKRKRLYRSLTYFVVINTYAANNRYWHNEWHIDNNSST